MKNISVHIKKGEKTTFTFKKPIATYGTRIAAKEVTVFWNFKNITTTIGNNTFIRKITFIRIMVKFQNSFLFMCCRRMFGFLDHSQ